MSSFFTFIFSNAGCWFLMRFKKFSIQTQILLCIVKNLSIIQFFKVNRQPGGAPNHQRIWGMAPKHHLAMAVGANSIQEIWELVTCVEVEPAWELFLSPLDLCSSHVKWARIWNCRSRSWCHHGRPEQSQHHKKPTQRVQHWPSHQLKHSRSQTQKTFVGGKAFNPEMDCPICRAKALNQMHPQWAHHDKCTTMPVNKKPQPAQLLMEMNESKSVQKQRVQNKAKQPQKAHSSTKDNKLTAYNATSATTCSAPRATATSAATIPTATSINVHFTFQFCIASHASKSWK